MDGFTLKAMLDVVQTFGIPGLVFIIWYFGEKRYERTLATYRKDVEDIARMYENNVELVKDYAELSKQQHQTITLNIQYLQRVLDSVTSNQFCPMVRLDKAAKGPQD